MVFVFIFILIIPVVAGAEAPQREVVRVALMKGAENVKLEGDDVLATNEKGEPVRESFPIYVIRSKDGLTANGKTLRMLALSSSTYVLVNGKRYRGIVEISPMGKGLLVVNQLPLEDYLVGLINCEISSQWPIEAIKAQAVIARSYAVYQREARKGAPYQLESSVMDQVYEGCDIEDSRAARGVKETAGEVLTYDGKVIQAFYHSSCGGHTEASKNVWGSSLPYLQGVECSYCLTAPSTKWEITLSLKKLESLLKNSGYQIVGLREIKTGQRNRSGRLTDLTLLSAKGALPISAVNFRKAIGYMVIKSTSFEVRANGDAITFTGKGYGHGVGLCQWGARQRAMDGFDYQEILSYYYPGTKLLKLYSD